VITLEEKNLSLAEKKVRADILGFFGSFGFNSNTAQRDKKLCSPPAAAKR